jgi:hypothetical protein
MNITSIMSQHETVDMLGLDQKFLLHSNRRLAENRHVMCVVEKARFEPRTLGTGAERASSCATALVLDLDHITKQHSRTGI